MKKLALKLQNKEQFDHLVKTIESIGFQRHSYGEDFNNNGANYLFFDGVDKDWFIRALHPCEFVLKDSWHDLVLAYLQDFCVKCSSPKEKLFIMDFFNIKGLAGITREQRAKDMSYCVFCFEKPCGFDSRNYGRKKEIPFKHVKILLESIFQLENQNKNIINISLTKQQTAMVAAVLNDKRCVADALMKNNGSLIVKWALQEDGDQNWYDTFCKFYDPIKDESDEFNRFFEEKFEEFSFENGLKTKTNLESMEVTIGCQKNTVIHWHQKAGDILKCGLDKVVIEDYSFNTVEISQFKNWLDKLPNCKG